jgi:hypothetical protein
MLSVAIPATEQIDEDVIRQPNSRRRREGGAGGKVGAMKSTPNGVSISGKACRRLSFFEGRHRVQSLNASVDDCLPYGS